MFLKFTKLESLDYSSKTLQEILNDKEKPTDEIIKSKVNDLNNKIMTLRWKGNFKMQREKMFKIQSTLIKQKNKKEKLKEMVKKNSILLCNFSKQIQKIRKGLEFYKNKIENHIF